MDDWITPIWYRLIFFHNGLGQKPSYYVVDIIIKLQNEFLELKVFAQKYLDWTF